MPTYLYILCIQVFFTANYNFGWMFTLVFLSQILISTALLPAVSVYIFAKYGIISSVHLIERKDRLFPNIATTITYFMSFAMLKYISHAGVMLVLPMLYMAITLLVFTFISLFWKISAHATAAGGVLGYWMFLQLLMPSTIGFYALMLFIVLVGGLLSARLYLGRHTPAQVYAGLLMGIAIASGGLYLYFR